MDRTAEAMSRIDGEADPFTDGMDQAIGIVGADSRRKGRAPAIRAPTATCGFGREASLARASRAYERDDMDVAVAESLVELGQLVLAADEAPGDST